MIACFLSCLFAPLAEFRLARGAGRAGWVAAWLCLAVFLSGARAEEVLPPAPTKYFNDYAQVVSPAVASRLNMELDQFERATSNQLVVAIFPRLQTDSSLEDYCQRVFVAWKLGQENRNNGAVLFVFVQDRKLRIHTGYGLEGALPDLTCQQIIAKEIAPFLRQQNYDGGLAAGVHAMMAAAKGEYTGTGRTANDQTRGGAKGGDGGVLPIVFLILVIIVFFVLSRGNSSNKGTSYGRNGRSSGSGPSGCLGFLLGMLSSGAFRGGGGGGYYGGGGGGFGGGDGGGGGFSGGGGDSGGGGASGSW